MPIIGAPRGLLPSSAKGPSPAGAILEELRFDIIPGTGLLPGNIPGPVDGWLTLLRDHSSGELEEVIAPRSTMPTRVIFSCIATVRELFLTHGPPRPPSTCPAQAGCPQVGRLFRNPELAAL
ncbi:hypothetical protein [Mesorhizobium sp. M0276]|uniref:hypothetical protein n=1 Tax=Mesorhizobium sp. M0276 TaxID=2956928 RepID=UPI00333C2E7A